MFFSNSIQWELQILQSGQTILSLKSQKDFKKRTYFEIVQQTHARNFQDFFAFLYIGLTPSLKELCLNLNGQTCLHRFRQSDLFLICLLWNDAFFKSVLFICHIALECWGISWKVLWIAFNEAELNFEVDFYPLPLTFQIYFLGKDAIKH